MGVQVARGCKSEFAGRRTSERVSNWFDIPYSKLSKYPKYDAILFPSTSKVVPLQFNKSIPPIKSSLRPSRRQRNHCRSHQSLILHNYHAINAHELADSTITQKSIVDWISEAIRFCCYTEKKVPCPLHMPNPISLIDHIDHPVKSKEGLVVTSFVKKQVRFLYSAAATARAISNYISTPFPKIALVCHGP